MVEKEGGDPVGEVGSWGYVVLLKVEID